MSIKVNGKIVAGRGPAGKDGMSPYQAAVSAGYTGTEAELNEALAGLPDTVAKADAAMPKSGGTFTGNVAAAGKTSLATVGMVNCIAVTDISQAPADLPNGTLVAVYEGA